jgi:excisionase family DNA binding protein
LYKKSIDSQAIVNIVVECTWVTPGDTMMADEVLTVAEVASRLRVSEYSVRNWLRAGRLRGYRPGGTKAGWRVRISDLERFIAEAEGAGRRESPQ